VFKVLFLSLSRPRLVRNFLAIDDAESSRNPTDGAQAENRRRKHNRVGGESRLANHRPRGMCLKIPIRRVIGFPYSAEVGFAGDTGQSRLSRCGSALSAMRYKQWEKNDSCGSRRKSDSPAFAPVSHCADNTIRSGSIRTREN
jgi:hypothetical protein